MAKYRVGGKQEALTTCGDVVRDWSDESLGDAEMFLDLVWLGVNVFLLTEEDARDVAAKALRIERGKRVQQKKGG